MSALDFFYPDVEEDCRFWGGYAKFFEPCIPDRVGRKLLIAISESLKGNRESADEAITILGTSHVKVVSHLKGVEPKSVICYPTGEAEIAIQHLKTLLV